MPSFQQGIFSRDSGLGISGQFINEEIPFIFFCLFFHFPSTVHPRLHDVRREMIFNLNTGVVSVKNERQFCVKKFLLFHLTIHEPILATIYQLLKKFFIDIQKKPLISHWFGFLLSFPFIR